MTLMRSSRTSVMDSGTTTALIGGIITLIVALIGGFWPYLSGKRKSDIDAQASLTVGFVALLAEHKIERDQLIKRLTQCEETTQRLERQVVKLERVLIMHNLFNMTVMDDPRSDLTDMPPLEPPSRKPRKP